MTVVLNAVTGAGYFDFYLLHNLGEGRTHYFNDFDMWNWVQEKKKAGLIKHVGFSFYSTPEEVDLNGLLNRASNRRYCYCVLLALCLCFMIFWSKHMSNLMETRLQLFYSIGETVLIIGEGRNPIS